MSEVFAHSLKQPRGWEPLDRHARAVGRGAAERAEPFGCALLAEAAGVLHDIGKASAAFQAYIRGDGPSPDHSTAGALEALKAYPGPFGRALAFVIAGHHAGLPDGIRLSERLRDAAPPPYPDWRAHADPPSAAEVAVSTRPQPNLLAPGFAEAFAVRMLFSCLVDADSVETAGFYRRAEGLAPEDEQGLDLSTLAARLRTHLDALGEASRRPIDALRGRVLDHVRTKAALPPGLFTLTVPTGGGKTLSSLAFALDHALRHDLRRVVYVIPFTSIIEQTAKTFREALDFDGGDWRTLVEHHAGFDWEGVLPQRMTAKEAEAGQGYDSRQYLRRLAESWKAPIVVTTAVQFFESLFANRTSRCRKLHNLSRAVIVLDEAQTLPPPLLRPCLAALDELARNYGSTVVLCTATQPAVRVQDRALVSRNKARVATFHGLDIGDDRELAPDPADLYAALKRVEVEVRPGATDDAAIAERFAEQPQMLCVVNSRAHARGLYDAIAHLEGAVHLSTLMCPVHRARRLDEVRAALKAGSPARVVSTSLIEAGVDISFPEAWRASTGLDSIAQTAGRVNRNGEMALGRVVVFTPADDRAPPSLALAREAAASVLRVPGADPLGLSTVRNYFHTLYGRKDFADLDATTVRVGETSRQGVLKALEDTHVGRNYPFQSIAEVFRLIDDAMKPVVVPYDDIANAALDRLAAVERPPRADDLRTLQRYTVGLPRATYDLWRTNGVIAPVRRDLGEALMRFVDLTHYRKETGVDLTDPTARKAEANIIS